MIPQMRSTGLLPRVATLYIEPRVHDGLGGWRRVVEDHRDVDDRLLGRDGRSEVCPV